MQDAKTTRSAMSKKDSDAIAISVAMTRREREALRRVAKSQTRTMSATIRHWIKEADEELRQQHTTHATS